MTGQDAKNQPPGPFWLEGRHENINRLAGALGRQPNDGEILALGMGYGYGRQDVGRVPPGPATATEVGAILWADQRREDGKALMEALRRWVQARDRVRAGGQQSFEQLGGAENELVKAYRRLAP